jgi:hypothetical protein
MSALRWALLFFTFGTGIGQQLLDIKPRTTVRPHNTGVAQKHLRHYSGLRRHLIVASDRLQQTLDRGGIIVQYVPKDARIVSAPVWAALDSPEVDPTDKLSPDLDPEGSYALVEFYPDVDMSDARSLVLQSQLQIFENSDLLDHDLLVAGSPDGIASLGSWDEVAYIFPGSADLIAGTPVNSCAGALTDYGEIGQSVVKIGPWAGSGPNGMTLQYAFKNVTSQLPADSVRSEIVRAFNEWAKSVKVAFNPGTDVSAPQTIAVLFGTGDHGDAYPFTSKAVLAHTFYPAPMNQEPIAGDMHFNDSETWHMGNDVDLFSVALHETGHALGLGHSDKPGAVMYPYYRHQTGLTQEDIAAIQNLYPPADTPSSSSTPLQLLIHDPGQTTADPTLNLSGTASGGSGSIQITWSTNRGFSGAAVGSATWTINGIPLGVGQNSITVVATDATQSQVTHTLLMIRTQASTSPSNPVLSITSPVANGTYNAAAPSITLAGTASDASGIAKIAWSTSQGASGQANGTINWTAGPITLSSGAAAITITAYAQSGATVSRSITVNYAPAADPPSTPPPANTGPPTLTIISPASNNVSASAGTIAFSGTATAGVGISSVTWSTSNGDSGSATGTQNWSISAVPVYVGTTIVTIRAHDASGNTCWRAVTVTRR